MSEKVKIVILAAGKGTRMKSALPKALLPLNGKHIIRHLLESIDATNLDSRPVIVVGFRKDLVMKELGDKYEYVIQEEQLGTGHAVATAEKACRDTENVLVISADQPFLKSETIEKIWQRHIDTGATFTVATTVLADYEDWRKTFLTYGRIIRKDGKIIDKEIRDCTDEELKIKEVNVSCYVFNAKWLWDRIKKLNKSNNQKEYLLTDLWEIAGNEGAKVESMAIPPEEAMGANSKEELEILEKLMLK